MGCLWKHTMSSDLEKRLNFEAWLRCNKQADFIYHRCMAELSRSNKEWKCAVEKHQDHVFCMHHEKDRIKEELKRLAIHVTDVGAAGNTTTNPSIRSNLGN